MAKASWRDEWPPFRVALVEETAVCLTDQLSADTAGETPRWDELTTEQQDNIVGHAARYFLAHDEAMHHLSQRGVPF
jgi:hypothetical protein